MIFINQSSLSYSSTVTDLSILGQTLTLQTDIYADNINAFQPYSFARVSIERTPLLNSKPMVSAFSTLLAPLLNGKSQELRRVSIIHSDVKANSTFPIQWSLSLLQIRTSLYFMRRLLYVVKCTRRTLVDPFMDLFILIGFQSAEIGWQIGFVVCPFAERGYGCFCV